MGIFDDGFTNEDAAVLGGIIGFAEESLRVENEDPEAEEYLPEEESGVESSAVEEENLRLIRNGNPELFRYIVSIARKQAKKWARDREDRKVVAEELEAMAKCERELNDLENNNDS
jgi:hypothetical protein